MFLGQKEVCKVGPYFEVSTAGTVEAGSVEVAAGGANTMEALEAAVKPGTQLPGFVSAGIVQPGQADQPAAGLSQPDGELHTPTCGHTMLAFLASVAQPGQPMKIMYWPCGWNIYSIYR